MPLTWAGGLETVSNGGYRASPFSLSSLKSHSFALFPIVHVSSPVCVEKGKGIKVRKGSARSLHSLPDLVYQSSHWISLLQRPVQGYHTLRCIMSVWVTSNSLVSSFHEIRCQVLNTRGIPVWGLPLGSAHCSWWLGCLTVRKRERGSHGAGRWGKEIVCVWEQDHFLSSLWSRESSWARSETRRQASPSMLSSLLPRWSPATSFHSFKSLPLFCFSKGHTGFLFVVGSSFFQLQKLRSYVWQVNSLIQVGFCRSHLW